MASKRIVVNAFMSIPIRFGAAIGLILVSAAVVAQQPPPPPRPGPNQPPMGAGNPPVGNPQSQLNLANPGSPQQMMQRQNQMQQMQQRMTKGGGLPGQGQPGGLQQGVGFGPAGMGPSMGLQPGGFGPGGGQSAPGGFGIGGMAASPIGAQGFGSGVRINALGMNSTVSSSGSNAVSGNYLSTSPTSGKSFQTPSPLGARR